MMRVSIFFALMVLFSSGLNAQKYKATSEEQYSLMKYTSPAVYMTIMDAPEWDTSTTYAEFFDFNLSRDKKFITGIACFKLFVNPTWEKDRHWIVCNCEPIDSVRYLLFKKFWKDFNKHHQ